MHLPAGMAIVGRDREQAELATALASTRAGYGRAVLLLGEAGMGKSMLADWLVSQAEQAGMQVARDRRWRQPERRQPRGEGAASPAASAPPATAAPPSAP
jgi:MoxR-like ATPase